MKNLKQALLALAILVFFSSGALAQTGIKGTAKDKDSGDPIVLMNVYVEGQTSLATQTDFDGNYTLELPAGTYEIVFSSVEYGKTDKTVTVTAGEMQTVDMTIQTSTKEMNTIIVKSDKYAKKIEDVITSTEVLKPSIIQNKAATTVTDALEQAPGLTIVDNEPQLRAGSGYSFGAGSRVMILVDDLPMLSGDAGRPSWGFIPIENVEQIEVVKGASSVLYGSSALNGVINVRTAYPTSTPKTVINLNTGVWDKPKLDQAKWWGSDIPFYTNLSFLRSRKTSENFSFTLGGSAYLERSFLGPALDTTSPVPPMHDDLKPGGFTNRARINFTTNIRAKRVKGLTYGINGNFMYSRSTTILIWNDDTTGLYRSRPGATTITKQPQFNIDPFVKYYDKNGNTFSLNTRIYHVNNDNDNNQQNANTVYYGEFRYMKNFKKISNFTLSTGATSTYVVGNSELYAGGAEGAVTRDQLNVGIYAQLDKKMWDRVNFTLGGRWEYFKEDSTNDNRPIFRAGASGRIAKATYVRASFGQGFRFPTIAEKYIYTDLGGFAVVPNPYLKPEDSWSAEIGFKQGFKISKFLGYFDVAGFSNFYKNYIEFIAGAWDNPAGPGFVLGFKSLNTGRARVSGVDVSLAGSGKFNDNFSLSMLFGYTYSRPVSLDPHDEYQEAKGQTYVSTSSDTTNHILKYRYEHLLKADAEVTYKTFSIGASFRAYSWMQNVDQIFLTRNIGNVKAFRERHDGPEFVVDARIAYAITPTSKVSFVVNNLLNREYALRPLVINPPRTFALQYTLTM